MNTKNSENKFSLVFYTVWRSIRTFYIFLVAMFIFSVPSVGFIPQFGTNVDPLIIFFTILYILVLVFMAIDVLVSALRLKTTPLKKYENPTRQQICSIFDIIVISIRGAALIHALGFLIVQYIL